MKRFYGMALLAAIAAAPVGLEAQTPEARQEQVARPWGQAPLTGLLQYRAELGLTADQVTRLKGIQQRLQAQNAPLLEQLRASGAWQSRQGEARERRQLTPEQREQMRERLQSMTEEERAALRQQMRERRQQRETRPRAGARGERQIPEELRPVVQQLQANTRAATEEARAVLTAEQQSQLRELMQQRRGGERPQGVRGPRGTR